MPNRTTCRRHRCFHFQQWRQHIRWYFNSVLVCFYFDLLFKLSSPFHVHPIHKILFNKKNCFSFISLFIHLFCDVSIFDEAIVDIKNVRCNNWGARHSANVFIGIFLSFGFHPEIGNLVGISSTCLNMPSATLKPKVLCFTFISNWIFSLFSISLYNR